MQPFPAFRLLPLRLPAAVLALFLLAAQAGCYRDHLGAPPRQLVLKRELPAGATPLEAVNLLDVGSRSLFWDRQGHLWEALADRLNALGADGACRVQIEPYTPMWSIWVDLVTAGTTGYGGFRLSAVAYKLGATDLPP